MAAENYLPNNREEKVNWLKNFVLKLPLYSTFYYIQPAEVADMQASCIYYDYVVTYHQQFDDHKINLTSYRDELESGKQSSGVTTPLPTLPTFPIAPPAVPNGIFERVSAIVTRIKAKKGFLESDGLDLGIMGSQSTFDPETSQPIFSLRLVAGGYPEINWKKGKLHGVDIYVRRNNEENFTFLANDLYPNFVDTHPLPPGGRAESWSYKLIYRYKDRQVGLYSAILSITVTGN